MMTKQEVFEKVATHLFTQGKQSLLDNDTSFNSCRYRGPEGRSCAIGCLIPDEAYSELFEGVCSWRLSDAGYIADKQKVEIDDVRQKTEYLQTILPELKAYGELMGNLQAIHDDETKWTSSERMMKALVSLAEKHELDGSFLSKLSFKDR